MLILIKADLNNTPSMLSQCVQPDGQSNGLHSMPLWQAMFFFAKFEQSFREEVPNSRRQISNVTV